jgi:putative glutathione S-transferase
MRKLFQYAAVAGTEDLGHIKENYHSSLESIKPARNVPKGPIVDFSTPHGHEDRAGRTPTGGILLCCG